MDYEKRKERLNDLYSKLLASERVRSKKELAKELGVSYSYVCNAFGQDEKSLTLSFLDRVQKLVNETETTDEGKLLRVTQVPLIPMEARGGSLLEYSEGVMSYDCERIVSPVKGADFAIQVTGDSMAPDYPSGCHIFIKKVDDRVFLEWGKVYVLDTTNGIVIKEIHPTDDEDVIRCVSINPKYQSYTVRKEHITGYYRVLMAMALK